MRSAFRASFARDLGRVDERAVRERIRAAIETVERAPDAGALPGLHAISSSEPYFRLRLGDHYAGIRLEGDTVTFVRILPRAELYWYLP